MKKTNKNMTMGLSIGMCLGCGLGMALGTAYFDNTSMGMLYGLCGGMLLGMAIGSAKDNMVNKQLEEQGYTIKEILKKEDIDEYIIVLVNNDGKETTVDVTSGEMETEGFKVGDVVFMDEDGSIEQAFDEEAEEQ